MIKWSYRGKFSIVGRILGPFLSLLGAGIVSGCKLLEFAGAQKSKVQLMIFSSTSDKLQDLDQCTNVQCTTVEFL